jgi:glutathione synthase/RimK-type ligase-like ATP-grasp enzyme
LNDLIVVDNPKRWPLHIPNVPAVAARTYLTDPAYSEMRGAKVFNLCRSYRYQSNGYYVSLLAMARGHKPLPNITTIQDMKTAAMVRLASEEIEDLVQRDLRTIKSARFTLSVYFGRNLAKRYDALSARLFRLFQAPFLRAEFAREDEEWRLQSIRAIAASDIPASHQAFVVESATRFFQQNRFPPRVHRRALYDLAILVDPNEKQPPSNERALRRFEQAGRRARVEVEFIEKEDFARLPEFDALFIRETTQVNHHTYRFARRAVADGLVVIDDPDSIAKCTNKVYLAELLTRCKVPTPRTLIVHKDNREQVAGQIGLPCILKQPDGSFSQGVSKADEASQLLGSIDGLLEKSDLIIAQEFVPTAFDWRIGVLERQPLFACKYHMVRRHWQIAHAHAGGMTYGRVEAVPLDRVPPEVVSTAVRAARLIGDGLYGVDLKHIDGRVMIMEINDNPNIDAGCEDRVLKDELYDRILRVFVQRIQQKRNGIRSGAVAPPLRAGS